MRSGTSQGKQYKVDIEFFAALDATAEVRDEMRALLRCFMRSGKGLRGTRVDGVSSDGVRNRRHFTVFRCHQPAAHRMVEPGI